ncbi:hypothetical protein Q5752_003212 [Cryptotrichosporon argae]
MWREDCREGHVLLGLAGTAAALVLLVLTIFSTPFSSFIYFLSTPAAKYGAYGLCTPAACMRALGYGSVDGGGEIIPWLTRSAICFGLAALAELLALFVLLYSMCEAALCCTHHLWFRTFKTIGALLAVLAEIFALVLWSTARHRFRARGEAATYGSALWIGLAAAAVSLFSLCLGGPKFGGRYVYRAHRDLPVRY